MERVELWESLRTSYWFVPSVLAAAAVGAAFGLLRLDSGVADQLPFDTWWLYGGSASGAQAVLAAIVSAMISVTGVVFSITIVVLSLASNQFGPRLIRNFMRDRSTQVVMGVFIATFTYALIILGSVQGVDERDFVPRVSVTFGVLLVIASAGFLIFFIHHIALAIQADVVVATISDEARSAVERIFPSGAGRSTKELERSTGDREVELPHRNEVEAERDGYIQIVHMDRLLELASRHDMLIDLRHRPGDWVVEGEALAVVASAARMAPGRTGEEVRDCVVITRHRSPTQDAEYGFHQLVEVAVRALSPGVNDPFTAMACIDWLSAHLRALAGREFPEKRRYDDTGRLRLIVDQASFADFVGVAFDQIRQNARGSVAVHGRLLEAIATVLEGTTDPERAKPLVRQAHLVMRAAEAAEVDEADMAGLRELQAAVSVAAARAHSERPRSHIARG